MTPQAKRRVAGLALGVVGLASSLGTWMRYEGDQSMDRSTWIWLRVGNIAGWSVFTAGAGLVTWSIVTKPAPETDTETHSFQGGGQPTASAVRIEADLLPMGLTIRGRF